MAGGVGDGRGGGKGMVGEGEGDDRGGEGQGEWRTDWAELKIRHTVYVIAVFVVLGGISDFWLMV